MSSNNFLSGKEKCQSFSHLFFHMGIAHMEITLISPCNKFTNQLADETDQNSVTKFLIILNKMQGQLNYAAQFDRDDIEKCFTRYLVFP